MALEHQNATALRFEPERDALMSIVPDGAVVDVIVSVLPLFEKLTPDVLVEKSKLLNTPLVSVRDRVYFEPSHESSKVSARDKDEFIKLGILLWFWTELTMRL